MTGDPRRAALGVLLPGFSGTTPPDWLVDAARDGLAGVVLFGHNTPDVGTTAVLTTMLHDSAPDLLVAIDEEGGDVTRLEATTGSSVPSAAALGELDDVVVTEEVGHALGRLLAATGIDLDLAPVLDVDAPGNPVIGTRAYGDDADRVSRHARAAVRGLHRGGVGACAKHFPGHGATTVDSHVGLPVVAASLDELRGRDLVPFVDALADGDDLPGLDAVMTAHVVVPDLGPGPASLEPATVVLVRELGFHGPVVTDALDMRAVSDGVHVGEAAVRALEAGADLLCLGTTVDRDDRGLFDDAVEAILAAVASGRVSRDRLAASATRTARCVGHLRARRARAGGTTGPQEAERALADLREVGRRAARTALRTVGTVPTPATPVLVDLRRGVDHAAGGRHRHVLDALRDQWPDATVHVAGAQADALLTGIAQDDGGPVVLLTRELPADPSVARRAASLVASRPGSVVLHTGVPSALDQWFDGLDADARPPTVLTRGTGRASADAAVRLLAGGAR